MLTSLFAELELGRVLGPALTAAIVPMVLVFMMRSAEKESAKFAGSQSVAYPMAMRVFVVLGWIVVVVVAAIAGLKARGPDILPAALLVGMFVALVLPLHLEAFGVSITWDDENIYTRSPWRGRRTIPFAAVVSCDYSASMQWYRVRTNGYGIVRLHTMMRGVPYLLQALPCETPRYPPF
jgi:uncharacterized Tic20 family protein